MNRGQVLICVDFKKRSNFFKLLFGVCLDHLVYHVIDEFLIPLIFLDLFSLIILNQFFGVLFDDDVVSHQPLNNFFAVLEWIWDLFSCFIHLFGNKPVSIPHKVVLIAIEFLFHFDLISSFVIISIVHFYRVFFNFFLNSLLMVHHFILRAYFDRVFYRFFLFDS